MRAFTISFGVFGLGLALALSACSPDVSEGKAAPEGAVTRVLFLGNSYTGAHRLPELVQQIAAAQGHSFDYGMRTPGGWKLVQHLNDPATEQALRTQAWDYVVLQDQSYTPVFAPEKTKAAAQQLATMIRHHQAKPVLYQTWAYAEPKLAQVHRSNAASMHQALAAGYREAGKVSGAQIVPVGEAWELARREHPDWKLHTSDGSHPTGLGAYLSAVVFVETLLGPVDPTKLPTVVYPGGAPSTWDQWNGVEGIQVSAPKRRQIAELARRVVEGKKPQKK